MKRSLTLILLAFTCMSVKGQPTQYSNEFGDVTNSELTMKEYKLDPDAEALVIYELGKYKFNYNYEKGFTLTMEKSVKIKILKQSGIKYAEFEIPYYQESYRGETFQYIIGNTYNLEGDKPKLSSLDPSKIYETKIGENRFVKKIAMPNVREGSVIEFKYAIETPYFFQMRPWPFQKKIPVVYSQLKYYAVPFFEYRYIAKKVDKLDESASNELQADITFRGITYREAEYIFGMKNVPAFKEEEFTAYPLDHYKGINFQLSKITKLDGTVENIISTWPALCSDLMKDERFGRYIARCESEAKKLLPTLGLDNKTPMEKLQAITEYVKQNYNWTGVESKYSSGKVSDFMTSRTGTSGDINLFLIGMLKAAKLDVSPIVASTRSNGEIDRSYPFLYFFDYVLAKVTIDNQSYTIDATRPLLYFLNLPESCINITGLVVDPKSETWVSLEKESPSTGRTIFNITINPEEQVQQAKVIDLSTDYFAYRARSVYSNKTSNLADHLANKGIKVSGDITVKKEEDLSKPFVFEYATACELESTAEKLYVHPFCNVQIKENRFKQTTRTLPIDILFPYSNSYISHIEIPEGYKVEYLPSELTNNNALLGVTYLAQANEKTITINASYAFKKNIYEATDYTLLKRSMGEVIDKFADMIILVKK